MPRTIIQKYASTVIRDFSAKAAALDGLTHQLTKGQFRELFILNILEQYLPFQFGIGTGIIVNQKGDQSHLTDIVIYDKRVLPPFIAQENMGIFPAESVLAVIEVKTNLNKGALKKAEKDIIYLFQQVYRPMGSIYSHFSKFLPLCSLVAFRKLGIPELNSQNIGEKWLKNNIKALRSICVLNHMSWAHMASPKKWVYGVQNAATQEETKRYIAILLDNIRTSSELRWQILTKSGGRINHTDLIGQYIRG